MAAGTAGAASKGLWPLRCWRLAPLLAAGALAAAGAVDHHGVLGLTGDATPLQVHLAYVNLTKSFRPGGHAALEERQRFVQIQQAFEALGDAEGKEEALASLNYWEHVRRLEDDEDLQRFTEFQPNGSAHLRIVFVVEQPGQRRWGVFAAAVRLYGRARVAQLCPADAEGGRFLGGFRLRQFPAAVIYDPVSRGMRVAYGVDGVGEDAERLLDGHLAAGDRVGRVLELDAASHALRCGGAGAEPCTWSLALASSQAQERSREGALVALRPFVDACQKLHMAHAPCFWLRLGRAPQWESLVRRHGARAEDDLVLVAIRHSPEGLVVAPSVKAGRKAEEVEAWLRGVLDGKQEAMAASLPPFPQAIAPDEEPQEGLSALILRKLKHFLNNFQSELEKLWEKAEGSVKKMDTEEKTMLAGAVLCSLMILSLVCRQCCCCCGRRAARLNEDEVARGISPVFDVWLQRGGGERLGLGIAPSSQGGFAITGVYEGTLVDRWNASQPLDVLRVRKGDRIAWVTSYPPGGGGQGVVASNAGAIQDALKSGDDVCLAVVAARTEQEVQRFSATVGLQGLSLGEAAELSAPRRSWGGAQKDSPAVEIVNLSSALLQLNETRRREGACCLQQLQVGDRVVSVNSALDVRAFQGAATPSLVIVRWRPASAARGERFRVEIERTGPEDRLGMHIRPLPGGHGPQLEVLDIVPAGAIARWNSTAGSRPVLKGDRILSVNGHDKELQKQLANMKVTIEFERWVDDSLGNDSFFQKPAGGVAAFSNSTAPGGFTNSPAPLSAPSGAAAQVSGAVKEDSADGPLSILPWRSVAIALLFTFSVLGDRPVLQRVMEALKVLGPCASFMRSALSSVQQKDQVLAASLLLVVGCVLALWFLWYEVRMLGRPKQRQTLSQLAVALCASAFLGCGNFCLLTWAGVQA